MNYSLEIKGVLLVKYNKLVRDNIPELIGKDGHEAITHVASKEEYWAKLKAKLIEEAAEFARDEKEVELADVLEIVYAIGDYMGLTEQKLGEIRHKKFVERGGFKRRLILEEVK